MAGVGAIGCPQLLSPDHLQEWLAGAFLGIFGALLMRAAFIAGGAALLQEFRFVDYIFGAFLVVTGARLAPSISSSPA